MIRSVCFCLLVLSVSSSFGQEVVIKFKIFDSNDTQVSLTPSGVAQIFVRSKGTRESVPLDPIEVSLAKKAGDFHEMKVPKGFLIEQIVIPVADSRQIFNPAIITKVVSNDAMSLYPGASRSDAPFTLESYLAQMGAYRTLMAQLLEATNNDQLQRQVQEQLGIAFRAQLMNMGDVKSRVSPPTISQRLTRFEQLAIASKIRNEVFQLYGLPLPLDNFVPASPSDCDCPPRRCFFFRRW